MTIVQVVCIVGAVYGGLLLYLGILIGRGEKRKKKNPMFNVKEKMYEDPTFLKRLRGEK